MPRHEILSGVDAELLGEDGAERLDLHLPEARQREQVRLQLLGGRRIGPHARGVAVVMLEQVHREVVHALGHRAREAVDRRPRTEDGFEVGGRQRTGVERPEALLERERPEERLLHRHLLVEHEADEQRHRVGGNEDVGLVRGREVQALGHQPILPGVLQWRANAGSAFSQNGSAAWSFLPHIQDFFQLRPAGNRITLVRHCWDDGMGRCDACPERLVTGKNAFASTTRHPDDAREHCGEQA